MDGCNHNAYLPTFTPYPYPPASGKARNKGRVPVIWSICSSEDPSTGEEKWKHLFSEWFSNSLPSGKLTCLLKMYSLLKMGMFNCRVSLPKCNLQAFRGISMSSCSKELGHFIPISWYSYKRAQHATSCKSKKTTSCKSETPTTNSYIYLHHFSFTKPWTKNGHPFFKVSKKTPTFALPSLSTKGTFSKVGCLVFQGSPFFSPDDSRPPFWRYEYGTSLH